jgi:hypothetical protein
MPHRRDAARRVAAQAVCRTVLLTGWHMVGTCFAPLSRFMVAISVMESRERRLDFVRCSKMQYNTG